MSGNFGEDLKKILLAGIGAAAIAAEKTGEIVKRLVEKGELSVEQGKELIDKLAERGGQAVRRGKELNEELIHNVREKISEMNLKTTLERLEKMDKAELEEIRKKLDEIEKAGKDAQG